MYAVLICTHIHPVLVVSADYYFGVAHRICVRTNTRVTHQTRNKQKYIFVFAELTCFCPPDSWSPPVPTSVAYPSGNVLMNCMHAPPRTRKTRRKKKGGRHGRGSCTNHTAVVEVVVHAVEIVTVVVVVAGSTGGGNTHSILSRHDGSKTILLE